MEQEQRFAHLPDFCFVYVRKAGKLETALLKKGVKGVCKNERLKQLNAEIQNEKHNITPEIVDEMLYYAKNGWHDETIQYPTSVVENKNAKKSKDKEHIR